MADSLELKEVELDYEAEEADDRVETPSTPRVETPSQGGEIENTLKTDDGKEKDGNLGENASDSTGDPTNVLMPDVSTDLISSPSQERELDDDGEIEGDESKGDGEIESGEELEDGEISDEDEALKNERLEPKAVCRFFSKGQCTWGSSCRFLHPGVLDKGNYSMFAAPRPILPGESGGEEREVVRKEEKVLVPPPVPEHESAWERGMRQAKEMRRRSNKRREMDVEYEEKKTSQSLTQVELDKENDYYTRPASPAHTHDPYAEDGDYNDRDPYDTYHPEVRRIAPPPPPEFIAREERERSRHHHHDHPPAPGPGRPRRIAPPRDPSPGPRERYAPPPPPGYHHGHHGPGGGGRFRGGEDWADPWMRGGPDRRQGGSGGGGRAVDRYGRKRSYSSGSSRSSSGSSRSRSPRRRRRYSSSYSSRSSSRSRSRSSTPAGIPRRGESGARPVKKEGAGAGGSGRSTAPLQKRLAGVTGHRHRDRRSRDESSEDEADRAKAGPASKGERSKDVKQDKPREPFKMNIPKNQIKLTLKGSSSSKPTANSAVLEKLGVTKDDFEENKKSLKRKPEESPDVMRQQQKLASMKSKIDAISKSAEKIKSEKVSGEIPVEAKKFKGDTEEAEDDGGADTKNRREELLKQLRAVEKAIHKKRSKLDK